MIMIWKATPEETGTAGEELEDHRLRPRMTERRTAAAAAAPAPSKMPVIGNLPVVKQFQVLGVLTVMFLILAAFMVYLDNRASNQQSMQSSIATEMQMLSQRLARGSALAAQGQASAFAAVRDSRERFKGNLEALVNGGLYK